MDGDGTGDLRSRREALMSALSAWWRGSGPVRVLLPGAGLVALGVLAFAGVLDGVHEQDDLTVLDRPVLDWLVAHRSASLTSVLAAITLVSGPTVLPVVVGLACLVWFVVRREWWRPVLLVGAMVVSTLVSLSIKGLVGRPRPPLATMTVPGAETTASFPSGHTIGTATLLLVAGYLAWRRGRDRRRFVWWGVAAVVGSLAVGLSRLYLGYHFLTDVLAAVSLAVSVLGLVVLVDRGWGPREPGRRGRCPQQDSNLQPTD